jgi:hypothetical protein
MIQVSHLSFPGNLFEPGNWKNPEGVERRGCKPLLSSSMRSGVRRLAVASFLRASAIIGIAVSTLEQGDNLGLIQVATGEK